MSCCSSFYFRHWITYLKHRVWLAAVCCTGLWFILFSSQTLKTPLGVGPWDGHILDAYSYVER